MNDAGTAAATTLQIHLGPSPETAALRSGAVRSSGLALQFSEGALAAGFKPMVRELRYDAAEVPIVTYLQAMAAGVPLVLLPIGVFCKFHQGSILRSAARPLAPEDLPGRRVGVRAWSQSTGAWVRGILANDHGVALETVRWLTVEGAHVEGFEDPAYVTRAEGHPTEQDFNEMLIDGRLDAAIYGRHVPDDPRLAPLIAEPKAAAAAWYGKHGLMPINHVMVVKRSLSRERPELVRELYRLMVESRQAAGTAPAEGPDPVPCGVAAMRPALALIAQYSVQQGLIPSAPTVDQMFDETTRALGT